MGLRLSHEQLTRAFAALAADYRVMAPKRFPKQGRFSDTDLIRYAEVRSATEIEWREKSYLSPKDAIFPPTQVVFYFTQKEWKEPDIDPRRILLFLLIIILKTPAGDLKNVSIPYRHWKLIPKKRPLCQVWGKKQA